LRRDPGDDNRTVRRLQHLSLEESLTVVNGSR